MMEANILHTEQGQCSLVLNIIPHGISTTANFWEVWGAAAAVTEMCVQFGRNGMAVMLGESTDLEI